MKMPWSKKESTDALSLEQERYVENVIEHQRADDHLVLKNQGRVRMWRYFFIAGISSGLLALMGSCAVNNRMNAVEESAQTNVTSGVSDSPGRFAATQSINQWLAGTPSPLPGGQVQSWNGATQLTAATTKNETDGSEVKRETDDFTLVDGYGRGYKASVQVAYTSTGQSSVISGPSLTPLVTSSNSDFAGDEIWPGMVSVSPSESVTTAVQQWAEAYTSGDAGALRQSVGDPSVQHIYVPISGVSKVTTKVIAAATTKDKMQIAQVSIAPQWQGRNYGSGAQPAPMMFDVLISGADTAAPRVVAWGSTGSGPNLKEYSNAITLSKAAVENGGGTATPDSSDQPTATSSAPKPTGEGTAPKPAPTSTSAKSSESKSDSASPSPSASKK